MDQRPNTIKLEEDIGRTLFDINHSNVLGYPSPNVKEVKAKMNKLDLIKLHFFGIAKETTDRMKSQHAEWKEMFANDMTNKGLIWNTYKQLIQPSIKKKNRPN